MFERVAIIGGGNGGKAAAAELTLRGKRVRLFEFPEFKSNLEELMATRRITVTGAIAGQAVLDRVACDLGEALEGADTIMVCTQALAHERVARELAPLIRPDHLVIVNPGSTGGSLEMARVFRDQRVSRLPPLVETSTLTYGCRAKGATVEIRVKANRVVYGTLPAAAITTIGPELEAVYPGLVRSESVLAAGLNNANPIIHPPIAVLNAGRIENEGEHMGFYRDGVSPTVARLIQRLDEERMALLTALGYPAQPDTLTSVEQGYAESTDYLECYRNGSGFRGFSSPNTLDHRYFHEDIGMGLVMLCSLGRLLQVPTPASETMVRMGSLVSGIDYFAHGKRSLEALGLGGLTVEGLKAFLATGEMPRGMTGTPSRSWSATEGRSYRDLGWIKAGDRIHHWDLHVTAPPRTPRPGRRGRRCHRCG